MHLFSIAGLDHNFISHIDAKSFDGLSSLQKIYLHQNRISKLDPEVFLFENLPEITEIRIHENNLSTILWNVFRYNTLRPPHHVPRRDSTP